MNTEIAQIAQEETVGGNTKLQPKQISMASKWCFTYNNYDSNEISSIVQIFIDKCNKYIFEEEIGESGTKHLQGYIELKKRARPTELKLNKKIHWEKCKGNERENIMYCSKDYREKKTLNIYKSDNVNIPRPLKIINELKEWQQSILDLVKVEPDDRKIIWIYENIGNVGKSAFSKYLVVKYDALYITEGKKSDVINIVYNYILNNDLNILILDIPRDNGNKCSYKSLEEIKNGLICNTKYETGNKVINAPHIIVFSNEPPDLEKFSKDRWDIYEIKNNKLVNQPVNDVLENWDF